MKVTKTLYVTHRKDWREWLRKHYKTEPEIWLVTYRKETGKPRIPYNDAVEEALCFGWIDSIVKKVDADRTAQRFSPRRPGSSYSQTNKERLRRLVERGKVAKDVLPTLADVLAEDFEFPPDILRALKANRQAWKNFQKYSGPYQRIRVAYVDSARKRPDEFKKRLKHFLEMTEQDKQFGYGIEGYF
jgi:uncharacterized protein YdeI (YjbR/CyaY-like superfamily)